ncbi:MAG: hypothetical protein ACD_75C00266G0002 [uncultured bacterium]|nr:MAG: hypothetical protein ACD_75C00266G0002 [uncultured bacterium]HBG20165.1 hypothetical protein [Desulfobulbaceae bacterium]
MPLKIFLSILFFCLLSLTLIGRTPATEPRQKAFIKELTATTSSTHILLFGTLENSFNPEMIDTLHSGIPLRFSFFVELYRKTEKWPGEQVLVRNFQHILTYDTLKENYRITLEEDNNRIVSYKSLTEAEKVINEINGARVVQLNQLLPDNTYKLKIRAEIHQKTLPLSLHNALPFLSWWDVETDWQSIEFKF